MVRKGVLHAASASNKNIAQRYAKSWIGKATDWIGLVGCAARRDNVYPVESAGAYYIVQRGANNSIGNSDIKTCVANLLLSH